MLSVIEEPCLVDGQCQGGESSSTCPEDCGGDTNPVEQLPSCEELGRMERCCGADLMEGQGGADEFWPGAGDDIVLGGRGDDVVFLGGGADEVRLGAGNDTVVIQNPCEISPGLTLDGGGGEDTLISPYGLRILLTLGVEAINFEEVVLSTALACRSECAREDCGELVSVYGEPEIPQAPGDEDGLCLSDPEYRVTYCPNAITPVLGKLVPVFGGVSVEACDWSYGEADQDSDPVCQVVGFEVRQGLAPEL